MVRKVFEVRGDYDLGSSCDGCGHEVLVVGIRQTDRGDESGTGPADDLEALPESRGKERRPSLGQSAVVPLLHELARLYVLYLLDVGLGENKSIRVEGDQ